MEYSREEYATFLRDVTNKYPMVLTEIRRFSPLVPQYGNWTILASDLNKMGRRFRTRLAELGDVEFMLERLIFSSIGKEVWSMGSEFSDADTYMHSKLRDLKPRLTHEQLDMDPPTKEMESKILSGVVPQLSLLCESHVPTDMVTLIENVCVMIAAVERLRRSQSEVGADEVLPLLIWSIVQAECSRVVSCVEFLKLFETPALSRPTQRYAFGQFECAVQYLRDLNDETFSEAP